MKNNFFGLILRSFKVISWSFLVKNGKSVLGSFWGHFRIFKNFSIKWNWIFPVSFWIPLRLFDPDLSKSCPNLDFFLSLTPNVLLIFSDSFSRTSFVPSGQTEAASIVISIAVSIWFSPSSNNDSSEFSKKNVKIFDFDCKKRGW